MEPRLRVVALIASWYTTSISLHIFNTWLFSANRDAFLFPLFTTTIHLIIQTLLSKLSLAYIFPRLQQKHRVPTLLYYSRVVPCGISTAIDIGLSNSSLRYIPLTFYTMIKSSAPVFILMFAFLFKLEKLSLLLTLSILIICLGVGMMVASESQFNLTGFIFAQTASISSGLRWSLTQILLQSTEMGITNPLATNLSLAPVTAMSLFIGFLAFEGVVPLIHAPQFASTKEALTLIISIGFVGCIAFVMSIIEFELIRSTSVVTFSVAGIFKEVLTIFLAVTIFHDAFSGNMGIGLCVSLVGIIGYNYLRIYKPREDDDKYEELELSDFEFETWSESCDLEDFDQLRCENIE